jgi:hypothetical protein
MAALIAVTAVGAVAAASAFATAPEFKGAFPNKFHISAGGITMETQDSAFGSCSATGEGTITGAKAGSVTITLNHCGTLPGYCHGLGEASVLQTEQLSIYPFYISKANHEVGFELRPKTGVPFAPLDCAGFAQPGLELSGSIVGKINSVNTQSKSYTLNFSQSHSVQQPNHYENEKGESVNSWLELHDLANVEREAWSGSLSLTLEKYLEVTG